MGNYRFLLVAVTISTLVLLISPRNQASFMLANAVASDAPQVRIKIAPSSSSPVKTFQVTPPASFGADQVPHCGLIEFKVSGTAGQTLRVQLSNTNLFLKALQREIGNIRLPSAGDSANRLYVLPQTGIYRFLLDPGGERTSVQFDFLASNNPMINPGIDQRHFAINFGVFAKEAKVATIPYTLNEEEDYLNSWPAHLALQHNGFEFRIMLVSSYRAVFRDDRDDRMGHLEAALQANGAHADPSKFPYPVYLDGFVNAFAKMVFLKGEQWRGLRWIGGFGQDVSCNPDLGYVFEGISNDDQYFVLVRAKIANAAQRQWAQDCAAMKDGGVEKLEQSINAAGDDTFDPMLEKLDAVVKSLRLQP